MEKRTGMGVGNGTAQGGGRTSAEIGKRNRNGITTPAEMTGGEAKAPKPNRKNEEREDGEGEK